jgi:hypothetical protein
MKTKPNVKGYKTVRMSCPPSACVFEVYQTLWELNLIFFFFYYNRLSTNFEPQPIVRHSETNDTPDSTFE